MPDIQLLVATHNSTVNSALCAAIAGFEAAFPGRMVGYYVLGSFADASDLSTSDLDLTVILDRLDTAELDAVRRLTTRLAGRSQVELDIEVGDRAALARGAGPAFKLGSVLVYGEDVRPLVPLIPLGEWTRDRMHSSYWRVARLFERPEFITAPLGYPDPGGEFFGYDRRTVRLGSGVEAPSTRDLIRLTGWAATGLLALERGVYVSKKSECHTLYREHIGGEWAPLLDDLYALCRTRWSYLIPTAPEERALLRELCERALGFENSFLGVYTRYLLHELGRSDDGALIAAQVMERAPYRHPDVMAALGRLARREGREIRDAAHRALARLESA